MSAAPSAGLAGITAGETAIATVGKEGKGLTYRGYSIHDLAEQASFEEVCYLLWHRRLPTRAELGDLQSQLAAARELPEPVMRLMRSLPRVDAMDALRTLTSALAHYDDDAGEQSPQANYRKSVRLTAQLGTLVAAIGRINAGKSPVPPDPVLSHARPDLAIQRRDGSVWSTDKDGLIMDLLAAEITARTGQDPGEHYLSLTAEFGTPHYTRIDAPATPDQKARLQKLSPDDVRQQTLAGERIVARLTRAPGNGAAIGGLKIVTDSGWFAARPSGTENIYKIYAESFRDPAHLGALVAEAQQLVDAVIAG